MRARADGLATRGERKARTRAQLLEAARGLMQLGRSFTSLGLREITREAGVVPTSFYRHFRDLDELGLVLVEEGGTALRVLLRQVRENAAPADDMVRRSMSAYVSFLKAHHAHFSFIVAERFGGSQAIRDGIRAQVALFGAELGQDLRRMGFLSHLCAATMDEFCTLVVNTMLNAAAEILDAADTPAREDEQVRRLVDQVRMLFLGAQAWRESAKARSASP